MVKKIIACSDIHIRGLQRLDESYEILGNFINDIKNEMDGYEPSEVRIVVGGDVYESNNRITNEAVVAISWFFKELDKLAKTIVIAGNHDYQANNTERLDTLSAIINVGTYNQLIYLDSVLNYASGGYEDDNIVWCLYSTFDLFQRPSIEALKKLHPDHKFIGLIHGDVMGSVTDAGFSSEHGIEKNIFKGLDFVIAGHIHKHQELKYGKTKIVYCSSLMQQNLGENISGHGYVVWDVVNNSYTFKEVNPNGFNQFLFEINDAYDIENNNEKCINL